MRIRYWSSDLCSSELVDFVPATKAHPAFAVLDLDRLEATITAHGLPVRRDDDPLGPDVLYVDDPFGNRIELRPGRGTQDRTDYAEVVEAVARETVGDRLADELAFVQELDRLKTVERQSFVLDAQRRENTAEHSWHVGVLAAGLSGALGADVD